MGIARIQVPKVTVLLNPVMTSKVVLERPTIRLVLMLILMKQIVVPLRTLATQEKVAAHQMIQMELKIVRALTKVQIMRLQIHRAPLVVTKQVLHLIQTLLNQLRRLQRQIVIKPLPLSNPRVVLVTVQLHLRL